MRGALVGVLLAVFPAVASAQTPAPEPPPGAAPAPAEPAPVADAAADPAPAPASPPPPTELTLRAGQVGPDQPPPEAWRLMLSDLTLLRLNPLGLETRARFGLQKRLYYSEKAITRNNFLFLGSFPKLNPASAQISVGGEIQPASILNIRAFGEIQQFYGTFGFLQSFGSANANYSDDTLNGFRDDPARAPEAKRLLHFSIQPLLQVKAGPIAVRALFQLSYWSFDIREGENLVYEPTLDTLLPDKGWTFNVDTDVLYTGRPGLAIGLRHTYVRPFYNSDHFENAGDEEAYEGRNSHHRLGLFAAYTFKDEGPSTFNKPTVILIMSWYLKHRWRAGEPDANRMFEDGATPDDYINRAIPYFLAAFAFESDFIPVN